MHLKIIGAFCAQTFERLSEKNRISGNNCQSKKYIVVRSFEFRTERGGRMCNLQSRTHLSGEHLDLGTEGPNQRFAKGPRGKGGSNSNFFLFLILLHFPFFTLDCFFTKFFRAGLVLPLARVEGGGQRLGAAGWLSSSWLGPAGPHPGVRVQRSSGNL